MSSRAAFTSKTAWDALGVESGEETEGEVLDETTASQPDSASESAARPSKSALKKQKALARAEKRQLEKAARAAARAQKAAGSDVQPVDPAPSDTPTRSDDDSTPPIATSPVIVDALAASLEEDKTPEPEPEAKAEPVLAPKPVNGAARSLLKVNGSAPSAPPKEPPAPAPAVPSPPVRHVPAPASAPESKPPSYIPSEKAPASPPRRTDIENPPEKQLTPEEKEQVKKRASFLTRTLWTFIMIGGFITLLLMGHAYMVILVMLCQTLVYREVTALFSLKRKDGGENVRGRDPWSKTLNWYFFAVTNYFLYGESIIYYFKHVVFSNAQLTPFATNHRFVSFTLYLIGFVGFVLSLKRGYLKQQFGLFCWVHMTLLLIVVSSHFIVNNILEGLIWFWVPASLVICNDVFAYIWGITVGRTPLIKLSPKKTVEGFIGAFFSTLIFGLLWGTYFMRFDYMICPVDDLGVSAWSSEFHCTPNPVFVWRDWNMPLPLRMFLAPLLGSRTTIPYAPYQLHLLVLACFASLVAPFGGFFASGFKRAFDIKDFGHSIPGHGGMTDRMDCQFLMGVFTYVYYSSLIRQNHVTVGSVLQTIVSGLTLAEQLELMSDLKRYLESQGVSVKL
ncbi:transporter [Ganoderma sinense ZZ0214-1]|uniref:Phosphatidate cytidylyltransferase n=1 Tax=Ganoderma sinense ZZ0214-1 TaxID=1077348 RepID=A0A2G8SQH8_9APHY|nr:transporter [Ganoderma sinense ZZ0214-1]